VFQNLECANCVKLVVCKWKVFYGGNDVWFKFRVQIDRSDLNAEVMGNMFHPTMPRSDFAHILAFILTKKL